jgi:formylmethanofuran dehydrogenase subunit B
MTDSPIEHRFDAATETALDRAVELLTSARMPLIYGLTEATLEAQAIAVDIAEALRGIIDTPASQFAKQRGTTLQLHGGAHTTWGESQKFADLFLSIATVPHISYAKPSTIQDEVAGRKPATIQIAIDEIPIPEQAASNVSTLKVSLAEMYLRFDEFHTYLRSGTNAVATLRTRTINHRNSSNDADWDILFNAFKQKNYPLMIVDQEQWSEHLSLKQVADLNSIIEQLAIAKSLLGRGAVTNTYISNVVYSQTSADYVLTARTGAACAISFAKGFAEYSPLDYSLNASISRGLVDLILVVGNYDFDHADEAIKKQRDQIPRITFSSKPPKGTGSASIKYPFVQSRDFMSEENGTVLRCDGVPIPWRPKKQSNRPSMEALLKQLLEKIRKYKTHF